MENLVYNWRRYLYGMWLGGILPVCFDVSVTDFRFWAVLLPTAALVHIFNNRTDHVQ